MVLSVISALIAVVAVLRVVSLQRKLTTISQSYWELRYDFARLRARIAKLDGGPADAEPHDAVERTSGTPS